MNIVIDTNILISALIKEGTIRSIITNFSFNLLFPELEFRELENHREELLKKSKLSEKEFNILLLYLLKYIKVIKTEKIITYQKEAKNIMKTIDPDDAMFIATAIAFNAIIWSDDKHFKMQERIKVLNTKEIIQSLC
ncbi:MAG: PIN domain-containing protein [archaeon]|nr:PIN domain-containing protein [archaeon]